MGTRGDAARLRSPQSPPGTAAMAHRAPPDGAAPPSPGSPEGVNSLEITARLLEAEGHLEGRRGSFFFFFPSCSDRGGDANKINKKLRRRKRNDEKTEEI